MRLGLIGHPLKHSWSPEIHYYLIGEEYALYDLEEKELENFLFREEFDGINVTAPYKKAVIPYLDDLAQTAVKVGAVNCIVKENGRLIGYNTDLAGLSAMIGAHGTDLKGKKTAILGTGGASMAALHAVKEHGGIPVRVSRHPGPNEISYAQMYEDAASFRFLINATPVGLFPNSNAVPCDLSKFPHLEGVIDLVANPLRTHLVQEATERGIDAYGGLEMLVAQAFEADKLFTGKLPDPSRIHGCLQSLIRARRNIVIIGMPGSGKSSIGKKFAEATGRPYIDFDEEIKEETGLTIPEFFERYGEEAFRDKETEIAKRYKDFRGIVIITGGGVVKREQNMRFLKENGLVLRLDRDLQLLETGNGRPLSSGKEDLLKIYEERKDLYEKYSDFRIPNDGSEEDTVREMMRVTGD